MQTQSYVQRLLVGPALFH